MIIVDADLKEMNHMRAEREEDHNLVKQCEKKVDEQWFKTMKTASNLVTLENYTERYVPIVLNRTLNKVFMPL